MHMVVAPLANISSDTQELVLSQAAESCYKKFEQETFKIHQFAQPNNIEFINQVGVCYN